MWDSQLRWLLFYVCCHFGGVSGLPKGSVGGFPTIPELDAWFSSLFNLVAHRQGLVVKKVIGKSFESRDIVAYCIGYKCDDAATPSALYNAMHHSREPEGMMV
jgi:hypothetical protein